MLQTMKLSLMDSMLLGETEIGTGGGVLLYIKEGIFYDQDGLTVLTCPNIESVWVNIKCAKNGLALGIMYRPPSSVNEYFNNMLDHIDNVFSYYEDVVLMWDLNYDYKPVLMHSNKLHQIEVLYGVQQLISSPTRVTLTTSSLIDVILSNDHESHVLTGVYHTSLSDHYVIYTVYSKINIQKAGRHKLINFINYKKFNVGYFRHCLLQNDSVMNINWSADMMVEKWHDFKNAFINISDKCAPMETRRLKNRNNPWIDDRIVKLIYTRDHLKRKAIKFKNEGCGYYTNKSEIVLLK